jgi:hypothetical protein
MADFLLIWFDRNNVWCFHIISLPQRILKTNTNFVSGGSSVVWRLGWILLVE